jgi:hypothetical protein
MNNKPFLILMSNVFLCIICLMFSATHSYAASMSAGSNVYKFMPNQTKVITNTKPSTVEARCSFITNGNEAQLFISMKKKSARGNGFSFNEGDSTTITVRNNYSLHLSADSNAMIQIVNNSSNPVTANCSI